MLRSALLQRVPLILGISLSVIGPPTVVTASKVDKPLVKQLGLVECSETKYLQHFSLPDLDGKIISTTDLAGQVLLLNFWAPWCHACEGERDSLQAVSDAYRQRGFAVVAISADPKGKERVPAYVDKHKLTFLHLLDDERKVVRQFNVHALPTSFVVGRDGRLLHKGIGDKKWDSEIGRRYFEQLLCEGE